MCRVGMVVKKIISVSGLDFLSLLAIAYSLVKWPKPTPLVGKNTIASFEMFCFSKFKES